MKLSDILISYRERMNISQRELARRCGLSNSYISFIENNLNPKTGRPIIPTLEQYKKLADGMDLSLQHLFEQLDEDSPVDLSSSSDTLSFSPDEIALILSYRQLSSYGKQLMMDRAAELKTLYGEKTGASRVKKTD